MESHRCEIPERGITRAMCLEHSVWVVGVRVGSPIGDEVGNLYCFIFSCTLNAMPEIDLILQTGNQ